MGVLSVAKSVETDGYEGKWIRSGQLVEVGRKLARP